MLTDRPLPPLGLLAEIAQTLAQTCRTAANDTAMHAYDRAAYQLARGLTPVLSAGDLLIPSGNGGPVYRVSRAGCACPAGRAATHCWHAALREILTVAWEHLAVHDDAGTVGAFGDPPRIDDVELPFVLTADDFAPHRSRDWCDQDTGYC